MADHNQMLREAVELARQGDIDEARALVTEVLEEDDQNVRAMLLLYRLTESLEEKRIILETVLEIDPDNEKAQEALDRLTSGGSRKGKNPNDVEVLPGITRKQLMTIGAVIGVLAVVVLGIVAMFIMNNNNAQQSAIAQQTAFVVDQTRTQTANEFLTATQEANNLLMTLTQVALASPTPTASETRAGPPTLPPTFTHTPTPTLLFTPTPLPLPPAELEGTIIGWGGRDDIGNGFLRVLSINVGNRETKELSGTQRGRFVTASSFSNIVYARYLPDRQSGELQSLDTVTGNTNPFADRWSSFDNTLTQTNMAKYGVNGRFVVFVARASDTNTEEVYVYDISVTSGSPLRRMTTDDKRYSHPMISPDGTKIIVVRRDNDPVLQNQDLYLIDMTSLLQEPFTTDGDLTKEDTPFWSPNGDIIAYSGRSANDQPADIFITLLRDRNTKLNVSNTPHDELYPVFNPDGRYIAYSSNVGGVDNYQIFIYDTQTGAIYQLTTDSVSNAKYFAGTWLR